ncbi:hypothetical protein BLNAU_17779 [Blattamonas nauphoetae]|uniref:Uncharacterized protein n=1 Tax=Blattamonas nauphoetae TaxID=2049346 RepID=A0ABQ9X689_9EUKA|nr:hypothetical protein BLNAU_17779 [Blattamonas nauphoetae]
MVSSSKLDSKALWTLFTPSQPHHAATTLTTFTVFMGYLGSVACWQYVWEGWFPNFIKAVDPSKLPFTSDFTKLHTELVALFKDHYLDIRDFECKMTRMNELAPELRREIDDLHLVFFEQTRNYIVHLSLHPFTLEVYGSFTILDFLDRLFGSDGKISETRSFREEIRTEMDTSALSSSPAPFILTSELILPHSDPLILNIVDRIVDLLASDSPLNDDTVLRIFTFWKRRLNCVYLPELFRKAGRSTEQYFHALESLLSLHVEFYDRAPIKYLLFTRPDEHQPTSDEWDDVDLETGLILMRVLNQSTLSRTSDPAQPNQLLLKYAIRCLPQMHHCSARHPQPQLERFISPSFTILGTFFLQPPPSEKRKAKRREKAFVNILKLCDERVIARCVSKTSFFSRLVADLLNHNFDASESLFCVIVDGGRYASLGLEDQKTVRKTAHHFLEEGWEDALEMIFVKKGFSSSYNSYCTREMMQYFGTNLVKVRWY